VAPRGTVLLVNGSDGRASCADYLRRQGLTIFEADRPEEAFQHLDEAPDVIVTDLAFAGSKDSGPRFLTELRRNVDEATSIVVLSGYVRQQDRAQAREAGADFFMPKSARPDAVLFEVQRALLLRRSGRRLSWNWPRSTTGGAPSPIERRHAG